MKETVSLPDESIPNESTANDFCVCETDDFVSRTANCSIHDMNSLKVHFAGFNGFGQFKSLEKIVTDFQGKFDLVIN